MSANKAFALENSEIDGSFRGGALNAAGSVNSTAVVAGVWAATTAYTLGQILVPAPTMTAAGGKLLQCTTAGTSGSNNALAIPAVGSTLTDGSVTWTAISVRAAPLLYNFALYTINKGLRANSTAYSLQDVISLTAQGGAGGDTKQHLYKCTTAGTSAGSQPQYNGVPGEVITDGTAVFTELSPTLQSGTGFPSGFAEVSGGSYARVAVTASLTNFAGTQAAGSTTASTGTSGQTSNNNAITFPAPTANWGQVGAVGLCDVAGNIVWIGPMTIPQQVNNGSAAPSFSAGALIITVDA